MTVADLNNLSPEYLSKTVDLYQLLIEQNPEIAEQTKRLAKQANPKLRLPEVELADKIAAQDKKFAELAEQRERDLIDQRNAERERMAAERIKASGFTKEEIEKVVTEHDLRGDRMIETAIRLKELERQQAEPGPAELGTNIPGPRNFLPEDMRKMNSGQLRGWAHNELVNGFTDIMRKTRAGQFGR